MFKKTIFICAVFMLVACSAEGLPTATPTAAPTATVTPTPTPIPVEEVMFVTEDQVEIAGTLFGEGEIAVLLLHMGAGKVTQKSWHPFAIWLAENGFTALTIDFRGRGKSGGTLSPVVLYRDAFAAIDFLRQRGYQRFICMGASMGGTACAQVAADMEGLVVISSPTRKSEGADLMIEVLQQEGLPKLFICGKRDVELVVSSMEEMHQIAANPKEIVWYDSGAHGTDLFKGSYAEEFTQLLQDFYLDRLN